MNRYILSAFLVASVLNFQGVINAADEAATEVVEVGNKICPVSHQEVGVNGMTPHKITYKGKVYNLCCSMCENDFNKNPEEYSKMMDKDAV